MATKKTAAKKTKSLSRDRGLVSSEKHEIAYAGRQLGKKGKAAVTEAKKELGRTASRKKVMSRARTLARGK